MHCLAALLWQGALLSISAIGAPPWIIFSIAGGFSLLSLAYAAFVMEEPAKSAGDAGAAGGGLTVAQSGLLLARFCSVRKISAQSGNVHLSRGAPHAA